ncbi:DUF4834 family protein [Flavobacterium sp. '19STA2R22 D10 B1']|uniref:DUF4834 family protein n=1 Tax=Flavobacterium aerium TaxID=3037261 RepID=UPI00278C82D1|nr:DUF4834 family protein [Flavobacterium sp. '19STA2R22 D10 B1']
MQLASFTGFIKTILILVFVYYGFKILFRIFAPVLMQHLVRKAESNFRQNQGANYQQNNGGDSYDTPKPSRPRETKKVGEYVDYEEIE